MIMKKRILIVEDELDIQEYYRIILCGMNIELVSAFNGIEALAVIDSGKRIDLILLDLMMPIMGGEEFLRKLRFQRRAQIPVIICSSDEVLAARLCKTGQAQIKIPKMSKVRFLREALNENLFNLAY